MGETRMKVLFAVACLVATVFAGLPRLSEEEYSSEFEKFVRDFGKVYNTEAERGFRYIIFKDNMDKIRAHNADETQTYTMALNDFADLTLHEFRAFLGYRAGPKTGDSVYKANSTEVFPTSLNWITKGAVTDVKNQGQCGSCWAFSTCAGVEGLVAVSGKGLQSLAPQELVDCDHVDDGCNGGLMDNGFNFIQSNGICSWNAYPYTARDGTCKKSSCSSVASIGGHTDVGQSENDLQSALQHQPISIAVDAEPWQFYSGGIFSQQCGQQLDHGVLLAGYNDAGSAYWLVKNSWGQSWGENGYIRLEKGNNECGLQNAASFPHN